MTIRIPAFAAVICIGSAALTFGTGHHPVALTTATGLLELLTGMGLLATFFAVVPFKHNGAFAAFELPNDLSRLTLDIGIARPSMLRVGLILLGISQIGMGTMFLLSALGVHVA
jgi:hypothetical protein